MLLFDAFDGVWTAIEDVIDIFNAWLIVVTLVVMGVFNPIFALKPCFMN